VNSTDAAKGRLKTAFAFVLAAAVAVLLFWLQTVLLLAFLGLLIAILLDAMASFGRRFINMPRGVAVVVAAVIFSAALLGTFGLLIGPLLKEGTSLVHSFPQKMSKITQKVEQHEKEFPWLAKFLPSTKLGENAVNIQATEVARKAVLTVSTTLDWGSYVLATLFLGIFLAWNPDQYTRGVAELFPGDTEQRIALFCKIGSALRSYLLTLGIYIVMMGSLWALGLWLIGIDYPLLFGAIGGLAEIAPYLGPFVALIPPLLYALAVGGWMKVLYLILVYAILHIVEGYILVPYLMYERERLPPPLVILSIMVFGTLFGVLGIILSVPLGTVGYVWVKETVYKSRKGR
jgi:predicted PurR-regulated permease PerM